MMYDGYFFFVLEILCMDVQMDKVLMWNDKVGDSGVILVGEVDYVYENIDIQKVDLKLEGGFDQDLLNIDEEVLDLVEGDNFG